MYAKEIALFAGKDLSLLQHFRTKLSTCKSIIHLLFQNATVNRSSNKSRSCALSFLTHLFAWIRAAEYAQQNAPSRTHPAEHTQLSPSCKEKLNWSQDFKQTMSPKWNIRQKTGRGKPFGFSLQYSVTMWLDKLVMMLIKLSLFSSLSHKNQITLGIMIGLVPRQHLQILWMK